MSAPRYYIEVGSTGTDFKYTMKLKTRVGDHKGLQEELGRYSKNQTWEKFSENWISLYPGRQVGVIETHKSAVMTSLRRDRNE